MDISHNEVHIFNAHNGHIYSSDCWCEPNRIQWRTNSLGVTALIVEHNDPEPTDLHHSGVIYARDQAEDWITLLLDSCDQRNLK
jgi:hypothetical protein